MAGEQDAQHWWQSVPKVLGAIGGTVAAIASLIVAINQTGWLKSAAPAPAPPALATITAPRQVSPIDRSKLSAFPRELTLTWEPVPNARGYKLQIEFDGSNGRATPQWVMFGSITNVNSTAYTTEFIGAQPGRWRVWAVDANGQEGPKSDWWIFFFTQ